jgi:Ca2+/Na+ antiporter
MNERLLISIPFSNKRLYISSLLLLLATIPFIVYSNYSTKVGFLYVILSFYVCLGVYLLFVFVRTKTAAIRIYSSKIIDNHRITNFSRVIQKHDIQSIELRETLLRSGPFSLIVIKCLSNSKEIHIHTDSIEIQLHELYKMLQDWFNSTTE